MTNQVNRAEVIARIVDAVYAAPDKEIDPAHDSPAYLIDKTCPFCGKKCDYNIPDTNYCCHCGQRIIVRSEE